MEENEEGPFLKEDELRNGRRIGQALLKKDLDPNTSILGIVELSSGLRAKLKEMRELWEEPYVIEVEQGDLRDPYGDGKADIVLHSEKGKKNSW